MGFTFGALLVASAVFGLVRADCSCDSKTNYTSYTCSGCETFPVETFSKNVELLHLSQNKIASIPKLSFPKLDFLDLTENVIATIEDGAFMVCNQLVTLNLTQNRLKNLTSAMLEGLTSLKHLHLGYNRLLGLYEQDVIREYCKELQVLNLTHNSIHDLQHNAITDLTELVILDLSFNEIEYHHPLHFKGMNSLNRLFLQNNKIITLHASVYSDLAALQILDLNNNLLSEIKDGAFQGLSNLETIHLSNNRLSRIHGEFIYLSSLKHLYLNNNPITIIENDVFPNSLEIFSLTDCPLYETIKNDTFSGLRGLKYLYVKNNLKLSHIEPGAFDSFGRIIATVDLSNNALETLDESTLMWVNSSYLNLEGNHWDCDCHLSWMASLPSTVSSQVKCTTPDQFRGTSVKDLSFDAFSCSVFVRYRRRAAIGLAMAVTVMFVAFSTYVIYRKRTRVLPCCFGQGKKYQTLYNASDPEESAIRVDFEEVRDHRKTGKSADSDKYPEPTPV